MTQLSLQGTPFRIERVMEFARKRVVRKIETAQFNLRNICLAARAREEPPKAPQCIKWINGTGTIIQKDDMLQMELLPCVVTWLESPCK